MASSDAVSKPKALFVEGQDEVRFIGKMCQSLNLLDKIQIFDIEGKSKLAKRIEVVTQKIAGHEIISSVGVVLDADNDADAAFASACHALETCGLATPDAPLTKTATDPSVVIMTLPGNQRTGMLEDMCLDSVQDDPAMPCVDNYFQCLLDQDLAIPTLLAKAKVRTFLVSREILEIATFEAIQQCLEEPIVQSPELLSAQKIHTFLTSRFKPNLNVGEAAEAGYWDFAHEAFAPLKQFLQLL